MAVETKKKPNVFALQSFVLLMVVYLYQRYHLSITLKFIPCLFHLPVCSTMPLFCCIKVILCCVLFARSLAYFPFAYKSFTTTAYFNSADGGGHHRRKDVCICILCVYMCIRFNGYIFSRDFRATWKKHMLENEVVPYVN